MTFDSIKLVYIDNIAFNSIGSFFTGATHSALLITTRSLTPTILNPSLLVRIRFAVITFKDESRIFNMGLEVQHDTDCFKSWSHVDVFLPGN